MRCVVLLTRAISELSLWDQSLSMLFGSLGLWKLIIPASLSTLAKMVLLTTRLDRNSSDSCKDKQHQVKKIAFLSTKRQNSSQTALKHKEQDFLYT